MTSARQVYTLSISLFLGVCMFSFQNFTDAYDQNETLDNMQIEDEMLQTSTDDLKAQQKEAAEQARIAEQERIQAESKLQQTKSRREQIEVEAKVKITQDLARRKQAIETRNRLAAETSKLEKEIAAIEQRMEKAEREAEMARDEAKKMRMSYDQLRIKKARLLQAEKMKRQQLQQKNGRTAHRYSQRAIASVNEDGQGLPRTLPPKRQ